MSLRVHWLVTGLFVLVAFAWFATLATAERPGKRIRRLRPTARTAAPKRTPQPIAEPEEEVVEYVEEEAPSTRRRAAAREASHRTHSHRHRHTQPSVFGSLFHSVSNRFRTNYYGQRHSARGRHVRHHDETILVEPAEVPQSQTVYEEIEGEIELGAEIYDDHTCHPEGACGSCCLIPLPVLNWDNFQTSVGVQGFTGPSNRGESGSFGFNQSFNWGMPLELLGCGFGGQVGLRTTQSNLSGAEFSNAERDQLFFTGGLFRRVDWGIQGGVVFDYLHDDWYREATVTQIRGEVSWMFPCTHEFGFWFASGTREDRTDSVLFNRATVSELFQPTDIYAFFYRHRDEDSGGEARIYGGFTGDSDGIIGIDVRLPMGDRWALAGGFTYLSPEQSTGSGGHIEESWNVGINFIWYPGCRSSCDSYYYRPLFDVADNGSFLVERLP